jgi:hypothetical protein
VREEAPLAEERVRWGWRLLGWSLRRYFCAVVPPSDLRRAGDVQLLFERGQSLRDTAGLLQRQGRRQTAVISLCAPGEVDELSLRWLIRAAIAEQDRP